MIKTYQEGSAKLNSYDAFMQMGKMEILLKYGIKSKYLLPWFITTKRENQALSTMMAFFVGRERFRTRVSRVPKTDICYDLIQDAPMFKWLRFRAFHTAKEIEDYLARHQGREVRVWIFGAGFMPEITLTGLYKNPRLKIEAVDLAQIDLTRLKSLGIKLGDNIKPHQIDFRKFLAEERSLAQRPDLIIMNGIWTYYRESELIQILDTAFSTLKRGGEMIGDFQMKNQDLSHTQATFGWTNEMHFYDNQDIKRILEKSIGDRGKAMIKSDDRNPIGALLKTKRR